MLATSFEETYTKLLQQCESSAPFHFGRIGGSDTNALVDYLRVEDGTADLQSHVLKHLPIVEKYNGFYCVDKSAIDKRYLAYLDLLRTCYRDTLSLSFCNFQLMSLYFKDFMNQAFYRDGFENESYYRKLCEEIDYSSPRRYCYPYPFVENLLSTEHTLFRLFSRILAGKRVLVVSPFSDSIRLNFCNREMFFRGGYDYPDFHLSTLTSPITYSGLPKEMYPHGSWFETLDWLVDNAVNIDFDIALLACGSYALPLGSVICKQLHKSAIYVGGVLQLFFGVMGRRYHDRKDILGQINADYFIYPVERDRYLAHHKIAPEAAKEAFGAYF